MITLSPSPKLAFLGNDGRPLVGGKIYTYLAGTNYNHQTYNDTIGSVNTNPVILDSRGEAFVGLDDSVTYKFRVVDVNDVEVYTVDNIKSAGGGGTVGPQGPAGADGATGPQGPAGADGATGPQGPAGSGGSGGSSGGGVYVIAQSYMSGNGAMPFDFVDHTTSDSDKVGVIYDRLTEFSNDDYNARFTPSVPGVYLVSISVFATFDGETTGAGDDLSIIVKTRDQLVTTDNKYYPFRFNSVKDNNAGTGRVTYIVPMLDTVLPVQPISFGAFCEISGTINAVTARFAFAVERLDNGVSSGSDTTLQSGAFVRMTGTVLPDNIAGAGTKPITPYSNSIVYDNLGEVAILSNGIQFTPKSVGLYMVTLTVDAITRYDNQMGIATYTILSDDHRTELTYSPYDIQKNNAMPGYDYQVAKSATISYLAKFTVDGLISSAGATVTPDQLQMLCGSVILDDGCISATVYYTYHVERIK